MRAAISLSHLLTSSGVATSRRFVEPQAIPAYAICLLAMLVVTIAVAVGPFQHDRAFLLGVAQSSGIGLLFAWAVRGIGFPRIADPIEQLVLLYSTGLVLALCAVIFAAAGAPLADPLLRRADLALFGVDRVRLIADLGMGDRAIAFWAAIYNSLAVSPVIAFAALSWTGKSRRGWTLLTAFLATGLISVVFLAILPAHGTPPFPYAFTDVLDGFRDGRRRLLDAAAISGIVTFPSMHAADALILVCAFRWLGRWALPLVVLNVLMIGSALLVGGHYIVDLVGWSNIGEPDRLAR